MPVEKGDVRNLTNTVGAAERDPAWSPDGKSIAYFSDESGEYRLHIRAQNGQGKVKKLRIGDTESYFYNPSWSPDCKKIACSDKRSNVWIVDVDSGKSTKIDTGYYGEGPTSAVARRLVTRQSMDGLLALSQVVSCRPAIFLYSMKSGKVQQITDGMSDAQSPAFDKGGKHLFFLASTDIGPSVGSGMSIFNRPVTRAAYVVMLEQGRSSPCNAPKVMTRTRRTPDKEVATTATDDSTAAEKKDGKKEERAKTRRTRRRNRKDANKAPEETRTAQSGRSTSTISASEPCCLPIPSKTNRAAHWQSGVVHSCRPWKAVPVGW